MPTPALLIIDDTERNASLLYATRFRAGDAFVYAEIRGRKHLLVSDLEVDRARSEATVDAVHRLSQIEKRLRRNRKAPPLPLIDLVDAFLRSQGVRALVVPGTFGIEHADALRRKGYRIECRREPFFPERLVKTDDELVCIEQAQRATEEATAAAIAVLRHAQVRGGVLTDRHGPVTSERLRRFIERELLDRGCRAVSTIVAGGRQAADPHCLGYGPLRANQAIILDVFPRSIETGYWADMTRTVVRGRASEPLRRMYRAVEEAQAAALAAIRDGVDGKAVHQAVLDVFAEHRFPTRRRGGHMEGFFHGTGHGVGLEIHEQPRFSVRPDPIRAGMVMTVEPGLYYPAWGGIRLEDLVVVTKTGHRNLTRFPRQLEL
jgi:Xaa-Pro aminopeptidase